MHARPVAKGLHSVRRADRGPDIVSYELIAEYLWYNHTQEKRDAYRQ